MINCSKNILPKLFCLLLLSLLAACGSKSSSTPTTIPNAETIYYAHNLVFRNSTTLSTGYNAFGQLGSGNLGNRTAPGPLNNYYPFSGFATGGNHSLAFFNNSTVRSWGTNGLGRLGVGNITTTHSEVPVATVNISGVTAVAAGALHSLALKNDGTVWAWGSNDAGQLGVESTFTPDGYSNKPLRSGISVPLADVSAIAASGMHSLALKKDGTVWAWGYNVKGQIGAPDTTVALFIPLAVTFNPSIIVTGIAAGGASSYAVAADGSLWAWGNNENGQLGNNTTVASSVPVQVLTAPGAPLSGVIKAAGGLQHGLALKNDGTVWAWGYNHFGQLGQTGADATKDMTVAVKVSGLDGLFVTDIRAFGSSSMAKVGGVWYVWGDNTYGQLGTGTNGTVLSPVKMSGF
jgi:alpha-tubulin suppressor-like RCC1 family protein